ncbi:hypothetical protein [Morganella morganii]|uniref:hypothetical protein n=1 Tax=Morganella morganii TaxID=582 RepID=UPI00236768D5|nr:hypothetical protein [Morganella morganii]
MNKNKHEEYIKEFDNTGVSNLSDLVRLGGIELIDDMLKNKFFIFNPYATHDEMGDEIDGVYLDEDSIIEQLKKIVDKPITDKHRIIINKWIEENL